MKHGAVLIEEVPVSSEGNGSIRTEELVWNEEVTLATGALAPKRFDSGILVLPLVTTVVIAAARFHRQANVVVMLKNDSSVFNANLIVKNNTMNSVRKNAAVVFSALSAACFETRPYLSSSRGR